MNTYRFSPIKDGEELLSAIRYLHAECAKLCNEAFGRYLPVAGNIGVFSHFEDEFRFLSELRKTLTDEKGNWNGKYFRLHEPITIPAQHGIPEAMYTHLYIRKPDAEKPEVGDIDYVLPREEFLRLVGSSKHGKTLNGIEICYRSDLNMLWLSRADRDILPYITDMYLTERGL